jgi:hypothetical protein
VQSEDRREVNPRGTKHVVVVRSVGLVVSLAALVFAPALVAQAASTWGLLLPLHIASTNIPGEITSVNAMSCSSVGNCSAGGTYATKSGEQAFVVNEKRGTWGNVASVPGVSALDVGGNAALTSIACGSAGNCSAVGTYTDGSYQSQAFVTSETNGAWDTAVELPGLAALGVGTSAVSNISCGSVGNCAVGFSIGASGEGFIVGVVSETDGAWSSAVPLPGSGSLFQGSGFLSYDISCSYPGNCSVSGTYDGSSGSQGFVDSEVNGVWGDVAAVPGLSQLDVLSEANFDSISCSTPGNCSAGGSYAATLVGSTYYPEAFVVSETNGVWGNAIEVPGSAALNPGGYATVESISCSSPGNCDTVGTATEAIGAASDNKGLGVSFSSTEEDGVWKRATEIFKGTTTVFVSCRSVGNCDAAANNLDEVLTKSETNGVWGPESSMFGPLLAHTMPSINLATLSCASDGSCGAGGTFNVLEGNHNVSQSFVLTSSASGSAKTTVPGAPKIVVTSPTTGALNVAITGAANSGGRAITDFESTMSISGVVVEIETWPNAYGNILPLDNLQPGSYSVRLRLKNALGWGPFSAPHVVVIK